MNRGSSCASVYVHHDCSFSATVEGDLEQMNALNDDIDIRRFDIGHELALRFLKFLLTAYCVYDSKYIYVRIPCLLAFEQRLSGLRAYHRRSADTALAILRKAGLIRSPYKPLPGNLGVLLELSPAAQAAVNTNRGSPVEGFPPFLHLCSEEDTQVPRSTPTFPADAPKPVVVCSQKEQVSTHMQNDRTSQKIPEREGERGDARRSDIRTEPVNNKKTENTEVRFGKILTEQVLTPRAKSRSVNRLITAVYCEALKTHNRSAAFWALIRSLYEREWPSCPGHSGVEWEQLAMNFPAMTKTERESTIRQMVLPAIQQKEFPELHLVDVGIPIDQVDDDQAAIEHLKELIESGDVSQKEGLVMLRAQQDLMNRRSQD